MEDSDSRLPQSVASWIVSLAISVACCAVLFVIFAGYLVDIKKNIQIENDRLEQVSMHEEQLLLEIRGLHHMVNTNNSSAASASTPAVAAPATSAPATTPAPSALPVPPGQETTVPATTSSSPQQVQVPATAVPEVPAQPDATVPAPGAPPVSVPVLTPKP